jgi:hypothetical protein
VPTHPADDGSLFVGRTTGEGCQAARAPATTSQ